jgi:hypothetical protein
LSLYSFFLEQFSIFLKNVFALRLVKVMVRVVTFIVEISFYLILQTKIFLPSLKNSNGQNFSHPRSNNMKYEKPIPARHNGAERPVQTHTVDPNGIISPELANTAKVAYQQPVSVRINVVNKSSNSLLKSLGATTYKSPYD